jgi:threonine synthase
MFKALRCTQCAREYPARLGGLCDACGGILLAHYEASGDKPASGGLWAWRDLLPPCDPISLDEQDTPLVRVGEAWVKHESMLVTGTFKARGAAVGVAMAKHLGARGVALPSAGNAGAAWAAYCDAAALPCAVWMAEDAPKDAIAHAWSYGAEVTIADGAIGAAGASASEAATDRGWHLASTFKEPWRVEGKKTALFEIARALDWRLPDAAVLPVGGGVGAVAWHKAAAELEAFGWAGGSTRLYAVQAEGCAPIVRACERGDDDVAPWDDPRTGAPGIRIPAPLAGRLVLRALRESGGGAIAVSEDEIAQSRSKLEKDHGLRVLAEAAAGWAGYERLKERGTFVPGETVVVYATG